jgi:hypothetical protein
MRIVDRPFARPMRCAAIPYLGQASDERVWFDTGSEMQGPDDHVYLSGTAVKECARMIGWVPPGEVRALRAELALANTMLADERRLAADLRRKLDAIDVIESEGFRQRRKAGRPSKQEAPA